LGETWVHLFLTKALDLDTILNLLKTIFDNEENIEETPKDREESKLVQIMQKIKENSNVEGTYQLLQILINTLISKSNKEQDIIEILKSLNVFSENLEFSRDLFSPKNNDQKNIRDLIISKCSGFYSRLDLWRDSELRKLLLEIFPKSEEFQPHYSWSECSPAKKIKLY
jgi:hypothetical protein